MGAALLFAAVLALAPSALASPLARLAGSAMLRGVALDRDLLQAFYAGEPEAPVWSPEAAQRILRALRDAGSDGLDPQNYPSAAAAAALAAADLDGADLLLTQGFLDLASDLARGRVDPQSVDAGWALARPAFDPLKVLRAAVQSGAPAQVLRDLAPQTPAYAALRAALQRYREGAPAPQPPIPAGPKLRLGDSDPRVSLLRQRLGLAGDAGPFDAALAAAVRRFQVEEGLDSDGVVGGATLAALNRSPAEAMARIALNLERWRWLPRDLGASYAMVNIAAQQLDLVAAGREILTMRVVVGQPRRETPRMRAILSQVVFAPSWVIPRRIAVEEMLPKLKRNPGYLRANSLRVKGPGVSDDSGDGIDWARYRKGNFPFQLRQVPGPQNALGRVKFIAPNPYDVFLHDTPARQLFARSVRAFSHGCVRLEKPAALAEWLLGPQKSGSWDATAVAAAMADTKTRSVPVGRVVPVYLAYFTAMASEAGALRFSSDIYHLDDALGAALAGHGGPRAGHPLSGGAAP